MEKEGQEQQQNKLDHMPCGREVQKKSELMILFITVL
jgi:hypothetical protein